MSNFHETAAKQFTEKAAREWVKLEATGNAQHLENALWFEKGAAHHREKMAVAVEAKPVAVVPRVEVQAVRACCVREMRQAFKAAQALGLNTGDACAMRGAIARYLGRVVSSRRDLSGGQWAEVTAGLELGLVSW